MLEWQYFQILGELQELQRHDSDPTCPCRLSDDLGENCLAKHSLGLSVLAAETAAMETDKKNASILWELSADAKDRHMKIKGFLCHKNDGPEFGDWSRQWRKKIEPVYYHQSCDVKLKDVIEDGELQDPTTDKVEAQTFGIKLAAAEYSQACPEHASERSFSGIKKEIDKRADSIDKIVEDLMSRPTATKPCPPAKPCAETPVPKKAAAAVVVPVPSGMSTKTFAMGITTPTRYEFNWKVVDAKDLIVSHDPFTFEVNPKFVQALQPRLRDRAATQMQVMNIAAKLEPDLLLQDFLSLDKGSPIVDDGNLVLCGNGRVMGIIRAIKENLDRYAAYREHLKDMAPKYGLTTGQVDRTKSPVLVREITTKVDKKAFAEECNASTVIEASPIEKAKTDAEKITPAMLNSIVVLENESIFDAIKAIRNKDFVISFLNKLPPNEQAGLVDAKGVLSQAGTRRIAMAIFVATFKGNVGLTLATKFFESNDPDVLTVFNGITKALSVLARAEALVQAGERQPDYAFGEDLAKVVTVYSGIRQTEGMTVQKYVNQQAFERQLNPFQEKVLRTIGDNARSGKRIGQILSAYGQAVIDSPPPNQVSFMVEPLTKTQLWDAAVKRATIVDLGDTAELFDKISDRLRAGAEAMQKTIDERRDPAVSHQNLTARRARQTANSSADADYMEEVQKAMIGLAAAIDAGTAPEILSKVTNRAQVDQILHRRYDLPEFHKTYLKDLTECVKGAKGAQQIRDVLETFAGRVRGEDSYMVPLYNDAEIKAVEEAVKICEKAGSHLYVAGIMDGITNGKRIIAMGLDSKENFDQAKAALKQYVSGPAPEVLAKNKERELTASLIGQKIPGFFPTPELVIDLMLQKANIKPGLARYKRACSANIIKTEGIR
jgi:hypothetical protein